MPVLIDGYNLYHFARSLYQADGIDLSLTVFRRIVEEWTRRSGQSVRLVFDGSPPWEFRRSPHRAGPVELEFTGQKSDADTSIERQILANTAPKRLTVVSSDLRIRKAAQRRRCKVVKSDEFWTKMAHKLTRKKAPPEPRQKSAGLLDCERDYWLKVFGYK